MQRKTPGSWRSSDSRLGCSAEGCAREFGQRNHVIPKWVALKFGVMAVATPGGSAVGGKPGKIALKGCLEIRHIPRPLRMAGAPDFLIVRNAAGDNFERWGAGSCKATCICLALLVKAQQRRVKRCAAWLVWSRDKAS